jgi:hypothetical protein
MSGLIKFKFGFENHLKICFEKLEKEKEKENHFLSVFSPALVSACLAAARLPPRARLLPHGPSPAAASRPNSRAAASRTQPPPRFSSESPTCGTHLSATCLLSFLLPPAERSFPLSLSDLVNRIRRKSSPFPCIPMPPGYKNGTPALFRSHPILLEQPQSPSAATVEAPPPPSATAS